MYAICDCYCRRCLIHDDCGGCAHIDDEAAFGAVHPVTDDEVGRPIFVYGTLRPGCGNDTVWQGRATATDDGEAFVIGYALVSNGAFPYAVPAATAQSVGCLIWPHHDDYAAVLTRMDQLEGVPHHYQRVAVPVMSTVVGLPVITAWIYTPNDTSRQADMPDVATRDGYYDWRADRACRTRTYR